MVINFPPISKSVNFDIGEQKQAASFCMCFSLGFRVFVLKQLKWEKEIDFFIYLQKAFHNRSFSQEQISEEGERPWFVWGVLTMLLPPQGTPKRHLGVWFFSECFSCGNVNQRCILCRAVIWSHSWTLKNRQLKNDVFSSSKALLILRKPAEHLQERAVWLLHTKCT